MKKIIVILLTALFALGLFASCSSVQNCPAYSDASSVESEVVEVA
jgi:hypothetical protein